VEGIIMIMNIVIESIYGIGRPSGGASIDPN
jgi:hypothetical protein